MTHTEYQVLAATEPVSRPLAPLTVTSAVTLTLVARQLSPFASSSVTASALILTGLCGVVGAVKPFGPATLPTIRFLKPAATGLGTVTDWTRQPVDVPSYFSATDVFGRSTSGCGIRKRFAAAELASCAVSVILLEPMLSRKIRRPSVPPVRPVRLTALDAVPRSTDAGGGFAGAQPLVL